MADVRVVTVGNLGSGLDVGNAEPGKISVSLQKETTYVEHYAGGSAFTMDNILFGSWKQEWARNSTLIRESQGLWRVEFDTPHPDGDEYHVSLISEEDTTNRDSNYCSVVEDSKTSTGFRFFTASGDNGTIADVYQDCRATYSVTRPIEIVTGVQS